MQNKDEISKAELLIEFQKLRSENEALKASYEDSIAKRHKLEKRLEEVSKNWQNTIDAIDDFVLLLSPNHEIIEINKSGLTSLDKKREEVIGKKCFDLAHHTSCPIDACPCSDCLREKKEVVSEYTENDRTYELSVWPVLDENNTVTAFTHIVKDITERRKAESTIARSEKDWEDIFDSLTDSITIHDKDFNIIRSNKAAKALLKIPSIETKLTTKCYTYFHGVDSPPVGCPSCNCLNSGLPGIFEIFEPNLNLFIEIRAIPRLSDSGGIEGLIHIVRDISERKKNEEELIKSKEHAEESDRLKTAFLSNISHEIRTPMNGILGFSELLKSPNLTGDRQQEYISIIEKSGKRMLNIITDLVDIAKIESGQMTIAISETDINDQINYIYTFFKPQIDQKGLQFSLNNAFAVNDVIIETDCEKLISILSTLIKNSIKYTNQGYIEFGYEIKGSYLEFFVKDNGIGIPKGRQEAIFERFIQADIADKQALQGAGLGLAITKAYVEMLGGKIWVESEVDKGSIFYFSIPYNPVTKNLIYQDSIIADNKIVNSEKKLKVLIAEDDEESYTLLTMALEDIASEFIHAKTGVDAVNANRLNPDIDLILMDIQMPIMNGYEATLQIRQFNKDVIIIAQTAFAMRGDHKKAIDAGCNEHISKPINIELLLTQIQWFFNN